MKRFFPFLLGAALLGPSPCRYAQAKSDRLGKVNVAGVSVSGLTPAQAHQRLTRELQKKLDTPVTLTDGVKSLSVPRTKLGVEPDVDGMVARAKAGATYVPLRFKVNRSQLQKALRAWVPRFNVAAQNAKVIEADGRVRVHPGRYARAVDVPVSAQRVAGQIEGDPTARTLRLTLKKSPPPVTAAHLKGIDGRLGRFVTRFNPGKVKRTRNMRLAIRAVHGKVIPPGGVFSLNATVGERTQARGYRTAIIFEDGKMSWDIGGGVSQVTGTLFNAALVAGLPIVEYRTHSRPVNYLPVGRDATVSWGDFDMKFRNDTPAPVYIHYRMAGNRVVATLYGKKTPGRAVKIGVRSKKLGERRVVARLYRTFLRNGKVAKRETVGRSDYSWKAGWKKDQVARR